MEAVSATCYTGFWNVVWARRRSSSATSWKNDADFGDNDAKMATNMAKQTLKTCLREGYEAVQSANFWAAAGNRAAERHALTEARFWFEQPQVLDLAGREKAEPLLKDVEARLQKLPRKSGPQASRQRTGK